MKEMNDLISRKSVEEVIQRLCDLCGEYERYNGVMCGACNLDNFIRVLDDIPSAERELEIIRCEDCIYFDPAHVEKDGLRYEYKDMPEEAYGPFGTPGCVTVKYGINVGSRCTYEQDNLVFRQRNDYCSRAEMRGE